MEISKGGLYLKQEERMGVYYEQGKKSHGDYPTFMKKKLLLMARPLFGFGVLHQSSGSTRFIRSITECLQINISEFSKSNNLSCNKSE